MSSEPIRATVVPPSLALVGATIFASQGGVFALDAASGALVRSYGARGVSNNPVAADGGTLYANLNYMDEHAVLALRVDDGAPLWRHDTTEHLARSPTLAGDTVYASTTEGHVLALAAADGALRWGYNAGAILFDRPVVADGVLFCSPTVNQPDVPVVLALDARTGAHRWSAPLPESTTHALAVTDGRVYVCAHRGCHAFDASTGAPLWHRSFLQRDDFLQSEPVLAGGVVYASVLSTWFARDPAIMMPMHREPRHDSAVYALRAADGTILWRRVIASGPEPAAPTAPAAAGDRVCVGTGDGVLHALAAAYGTPIWRHQTDGRALSTPIVAGETVYVGASDGCVYALDASDGTRRWRTFTSTAVSVAAGLRMGNINVQSQGPSGES